MISGKAPLERQMAQRQASSGMRPAAFAIPASSQRLPAKTRISSRMLAGTLASSRRGSTTPWPKIEKSLISVSKLVEPMEQATDSRLETSITTSPCGCTKISRPVLASPYNARSSGCGTSTMESLKTTGIPWSHTSEYIRTMLVALTLANTQEAMPIPSDGLSQIPSTSLSLPVAKQGFGMSLAVLRVNGSTLALSPTSRTGFTGRTNLL